MIHILSIGKAAWQMAWEMQQRLDPAQIQKTIVLTKYGFFPPAAPKLPNAVILEAGHPLPDANSLKHSEWIMNYLQEIPPSEKLIILISGGSSALFEIPAKGYTLEDIIALNRLLLASGLDIAQMNFKRSEISQVKGGKALQEINCQVLGLYLLSDVKGDDPATIGSGAFYDPARGIPCQIIGNVAGYLKGYAHCLSKIYPGRIRIQRSFVDSEPKVFARQLCQISQGREAGIYLYGGELGLSKKGEGKGGRCTHLALMMAKHLSGQNGRQFMAYATDGNDNLLQSAGAIIDGNSWQAICEKGINAENALLNFDSYTALSAIDAIIPGSYTGTNVNEIYAFCSDPQFCQDKDLSHALLRYPPAFRF